ncbi:hypothetical protein [Lactiplantibacillus plantarum]|uniref:hypothetical protein n=1 Tax=Lactiplantibacillus plantarum TaxID=1590 RepID=UPI003525192F
MDNASAAKSIRHAQYYNMTGFFDNVSHAKLIRQLWTLGIQDKWLLGIIRAMLHAPVILPNGHSEHPKKELPKVVYSHQY